MNIQSRIHRITEDANGKTVSIEPFEDIDGHTVFEHDDACEIAASAAHSDTGVHPGVIEERRVFYKVSPVDSFHDHKVERFPE